MAEHAPTHSHDHCAVPAYQESECVFVIRVENGAQHVAVRSFIALTKEIVNRRQDRLDLWFHPAAPPTGNCDREKTTHHNGRSKLNGYKFFGEICFRTRTLTGLGGRNAAYEAAKPAPKPPAVAKKR